MPLSFDQTWELERLGTDKVLEGLRDADPGPRSIVPGLGDGKMLRGDVEGWLAERDKADRDEKLQGGPG